MISIQPSYAHSTETIATPKAGSSASGEPAGHTGWKFWAEPPGSASPATISSSTRPIFSAVSTFCVSVPGFTPRQLSTVSTTVVPAATQGIAPGLSGMKYPRYVAQTTEIAAIEAGLITIPAPHPYR